MSVIKYVGNSIEIVNGASSVRWNRAHDVDRNFVVALVDQFDNSSLPRQLLKRWLAGEKVEFGQGNSYSCTLDGKLVGMYQDVVDAPYEPWDTREAVMDLLLALSA